MNTALKIFRLQHPGSCTGMYWRADPRISKKTTAGPPDWPRNGALLKGSVHDFSDSMPEESQFWLEVS